MPRQIGLKNKIRHMQHPSTIDEYLDGLDTQTRKALERLRQIIKEFCPDSEECISYSVPAFRVSGAIVAGFSATAKGCSYFPFSASTLTALKAHLGGFRWTKGAVHFYHDKPMPKMLIERILRTRLAEVAIDANKRSIVKPAGNGVN